MCSWFTFKKHLNFDAAAQIKRLWQVIILASAEGNSADTLGFGGTSCISLARPNSQQGDTVTWDLPLRERDGGKAEKQIFPMLPACVKERGMD